MWIGEDWEKDGGGAKMEMMAGLKAQRGEDEDIVCVNITHWLHVLQTLSMLLHNSLVPGYGG